MKTWHECVQILDHLETANARGEDAALAVLVHIEGSSYRRPGAKMLVSSSGSRWGSISGGCLEEDVRQVALEVMRRRSPRCLRYETGSDDETVWGMGLGCDGVVELFVQPASIPDFLETVAPQRSLLNAEAPFSVATVVEVSAGSGEVGRRVVIAAGEIAAGGTADASLDDRVVELAASLSNVGESALHEVASATVFLESYLPPPCLLVIGAGDDAMPLVRLSAEVGFRVYVVDHRPAYLTEDRFPEAWRLLRADGPGNARDLPLGSTAFAVTKTHSLNRDREWVQALVEADLPYVGLLGPRDRREEILGALHERARERVYGPVGLDLGGEGPEQVALSVVAELLAVVAGRKPGHLRDTSGPIHSELQRQS